MKFLIVVINFLCYLALISINDKKLKYILTAFFVTISVVFCFLVDFTKMPDYQEYFNVIGNEQQEFSIKFFFSEPYYFESVNFISDFLSKETSIAIFYIINTLLTTFFFVWLAFIKEVPIWRKVLLYSFYYYFFSYVLLRNTPSYVLVGILFYYLNRKIFFKFSVLSFLCHLSSLPVLFFSIFKNKKANFLLLVIVLGYLLFFNLLTNLEIFGVYEKLNTYKDDKEFGQGFFHKIYFFGFLTINLFLIFRKKSEIFNYTYILLFVTYLFLQFIGPVMGYRFSIYLIFYLLLSDDLFFSKTVNSYLNIVSVGFLGIVLYNFNLLF